VRESERARTGETAAADRAPRSGSARRGGLLVPALIFAALVLAVSLAGWAIFARQASDMRAQNARSLLAVQKLQSSQVSNWFTDEVHDTRLLANAQSIVAPLKRYMDGASRRVPESLRAQLELYRRGHGVASVSVLDPDLVPIVQAPVGAGAAHAHPPTPPMTGIAARALREDRVVFSGVYQEAGDAVMMDFAAPLRDLSASPGSVIGVLVVHVDATEGLFPLLTAWPRHSRPARPRCGPCRMDAWSP
jgi:hypothetical protein